MSGNETDYYMQDPVEAQVMRETALSRLESGRATSADISNLGDLFKYVCRRGKKDGNPAADAEKAYNYLFRFAYRCWPWEYEGGANG